MEELSVQTRGKMSQVGWWSSTLDSIKTKFWGVKIPKKIGMNRPLRTFEGDNLLVVKSLNQINCTI